MTDFEPTKTPNKKVEYTEEQLIDLIQCTDDPIYFIEKFVKVQHPTKGMLPLILYPFQVEMVKAYRDHRKVVSLCSRQTGKALSLDTPIPTPSGWTTIRDIHVGDHVLGDDGEPTMVDFVTDIMTNHDCYEIDFGHGETITADAEHIWKVGSAGWTRERELTTEQLIPIIERARAIKQSIFVTATKPINLPLIDLPIDPYTLGCWVGDGYSASGRICGHANDLPEILTHINETGYEVREVKYDKRNGLARCTIKELHQKLRENNILNNKHIPKLYLRASVEQRLELVRGLMDTDGSVSKRGSYEFYQKKRDIIDSFSELLFSLGIKNTIRVKNINGSDYFTVAFSTKIPVFKLKRKLDLQSYTMGHPKNKRMYIHAIQKVDSVPVRCIRVTNESHMFLCGKSMIPTHNTTTASAYLLWYAMFNDDQTILIASNVYRAAQEIMHRIRTAYEECPDYIRAGVTAYNKQSISFDNGSRIISQATTENTGRGMSISLLYCLAPDTNITVRNKKNGEIKTISIGEMYRTTD